MKALALLAPLAILCTSCTTTTTYWVPVYTMQTSETQERSGFDPATRTITNPEEGATFACYEGEHKQAIVYSDRCSLSLARKIVAQDAGFNAAESTAEAISNLVLTKSFLTGGTDGTGVKLPEDPEGTLKSAGIDYRGGFLSPAEVYRRNLYLEKSENLLVFDERLLQDGQELSYVISGRNAGTDNLAEIVVLDVLPPGFDPVETRCWFSNEADAVLAPELASFFQHSKVASGGRTSLVFKSTLGTPFKPGDEFRIKVTVRLDRSSLTREFVR